MRRVEGFTLIEVVVALAVVALALGSVVVYVGQAARAQRLLEERVFASWVARNRLAEAQLARPWPAPGRYEGQELLSGRTWRWRLGVEESRDDSVRRLHVEVFTPDGATPTSVLDGFCGRRELG